MFYVAGGERASPLCEGIGHHSRGLSGSEDMLILAIILIMQEQQSSGLRTVTSGCRWSLGEPRRSRVSPEDIQKVFRGPTGLWGSEEELAHSRGEDLTGLG